MKWPNVNTPLAAVVVRFVVRTAGAPTAVAALLREENAEHADLLPVHVAWNETRMRGPVLSLGAWLRHATAAYPDAAFVAKVDDDVYLHLPDVEAMLRAVASTAGIDAEHAYMGPITYFHWYLR